MPLFTAIGVKNTPDGRDFVDILLDIAGEHFEQSKSVAGPDRAVYDICFAGMCAADEREELTPADLQRLKEAPSILNIRGQPTYPDEVLIQDSEWHAGFFGGELDVALCKPAPELWPVVEKVGVRRLSESAQVALEFVDGPQADEGPLADKLMERIGIVVRLLHDKPTTVRAEIRSALSELEAVSYEVVRIQASVHLGGDEVSAPPASAQAFYDIDGRCLILARPVGDRIWSHILNALFHQLMPEESASEISKLTLSVRPLMGMSVEEAHRELTDAGIPYLDADVGGGEAEDLTSHDLNEMGSASGPVAEEEAQREHERSERASAQAGSRAEESEGTGRPDGEPRTRPQEGSSGQERRANGSGDSPLAKPTDHLGPPPDRAEGKNSDPGERRAKKSRAKYKEQWDRRLLSYVRKSSENQPGADTDGAVSEHNLAVEALSRAAVCSYEKSRGRIPERMAQTHPGYDIVSRNPLTGEERFIEVKGVNGEWNKTGVGLSRLQFSNAQDYGERFWLYVVEFVGDPEHMRVHPIQSPATQVTSFMFDGNWRDVVAEERADPSLAFIAGAKVKHQHWGRGCIASMELRGATRVMSIDFEKHGRRTVTLNLQMMSVVADADGNDRQP